MINGQENRMTIPQIDKAIKRIDEQKITDPRAQEELLSYKKRLTTAKNRILRYYAKAKVKYPAIATKKNTLTVMAFTGKWTKQSWTQKIGVFTDKVKQTANSGIDFLEDNKGLIIGIGSIAAAHAVVGLIEEKTGKALKEILETWIENNPKWAMLIGSVGLTAALLSIPTLRSKVRNKTNERDIQRAELKNAVLEETMEEPENELLNKNLSTEDKAKLIEEVAQTPELLGRLKSIYAAVANDPNNPQRLKLAQIIREAELKEKQIRTEQSQDLIKANNAYQIEALGDEYFTTLDEVKKELEENFKEKFVNAFVYTNEQGQKIKEPELNYSKGNTPDDLKKTIINSYISKLTKESTNTSEIFNLYYSMLSKKFTGTDPYISNGVARNTEDIRTLLNKVDYKALVDWYAPQDTNVNAAYEKILKTQEEHKARVKQYNADKEQALNQALEKALNKYKNENLDIDARNSQKIEEIKEKMRKFGALDNEIDNILSKAKTRKEAARTATQLD